MVGVTTAFYLQADGHDVTVIERNKSSGLETSFANAGQLCRFTAKPWASPSVPMMIIREVGNPLAPYLIHLRADIDMWSWLLRFLNNCRRTKYDATRTTLLELAVHSAGLMEDLIDTTNIEFDYGRSGILHLYGNQKSFDSASNEQLQCFNTEQQGKILQTSECIALEPALAQGGATYVGGILHTHEHTGDAHRFTTELSSLLTTRGVEFLYGVSAKKLLFDGDRVSGITTSNGTLKGDAVVVSAAVDSVSLLKPACSRIPIYPVKGYSITVATSGYNGAPKISVHDHERKIGFTKLGDRLRAAGTAELGAREKAPSQARIEALRKQTQTMFPGAGDFESAEPWAGFRPMTPDGAPIVSKTKYKNLFVNTGHGSLGWSLACGSAHTITEMIAGRTPAIETSGLVVDRYG